LKGGEYLAPLLTPAYDGDAGADRARARPRDRPITQQHLQFAAVDQELRPSIVRTKAARLAPHDLAIARSIDGLCGAQPNGVKIVGQAEREQAAHYMGLDVDADAKGAQSRRSLMDHKENARLMPAEHQAVRTKRIQELIAAIWTKPRTLAAVLS
jgi:hypothetical protein